MQYSHKQYYHKMQIPYNYSNDMIYLMLPLDKTITSLTFGGKGYVGFADFPWPKKLVHLETNFRPKLSELPSTLETLVIETQNKVLRSELPYNLKTLVLVPPNSNPCVFDLIDDDSDAYYIDFFEFDKYNKFIGGTLQDCETNCIDNNYVMYHYECIGDCYTKKQIQDNENPQYVNYDYDTNGNLACMTCDSRKIRISI